MVFQTTGKVRRQTENQQKSKNLWFRLTRTATWLHQIIPNPCIVVPFGGHSYVPPKPVSSRRTCSANESCWAMRWATSLSHQGKTTHMSYLKSLGSSRHHISPNTIVSIVRNTTVVKSNKGQEQNQNPGRSPFLVVLEVCAFLLYGCKNMQKQLNPVRSKQSATTCQAWWFSYGLW